MFFHDDSDSNVFAAGTTTDNRNITIERSGSGFVLKSQGSSPQYSSDYDYLMREFEKQVPSGHRFL